VLDEEQFFQHRISNILYGVEAEVLRRYFDEISFVDIVRHSKKDEPKARKKTGFARFITSHDL
jgi:hypothetical protein